VFVARAISGELRDGRAQWLAAREEQVDMRDLARGDVPATWATDRNRLQPALHAAGWDFLWYDPTVAPQAPAGDLPRHALEALAIEGYRQGVLARSQVRRMLGFETRGEVDEFMMRAGVPFDYNLDDFAKAAVVTLVIESFVMIDVFKLIEFNDQEIQAIKGELLTRFGQ